MTNDGRAVGTALRSPYRGFAWSPDQAYQLLPVSTQPNWTTTPSLINERGLIVGATSSYVVAGDRSQPMAWLPGSNTAIELSRVGPSGTYNTGQYDFGNISSLNANDHMAGNMIRRSESGALLGQVAVRWNGLYADPVELGGIPISGRPLGHTYAFHQTESGMLIGVGMLSTTNLNIGSGPTAAIRWAANSVVPQRLDDLSIRPGGSQSVPRDINESGVVVGASDYYKDGAQLARYPVRWDATSSAITPLAVPPTEEGRVWGEAQQINNRGTIMGWVQTVQNGLSVTAFPARWHVETNTVTLLENLGSTSANFYRPTVADMNESDSAVGGCYRRSSTTFDELRAVVWPGQSTSIVDLNDLLSPSLSPFWKLQYALCVTDTGWVSGSGKYDADGIEPGAAVDRAFAMLVPQAGTYGRGDANFDTLVNFDDLLILAQHYGQANPTQDVHVADLNLDGVTDFDDLLKLAQNYQGSALVNAGAFGSDFSSAWVLARSMVPEPVGASIGLIARALVRRRR